MHICICSGPFLKLMFTGHCVIIFTQIQAGGPPVDAEPGLLRAAAAWEGKEWIKKE
jgi:hypothetical protein